MSVTKEVKIGLLAVISLVIFFVGFYFLKGANIFSSDQEFISYYSNVEGLQNSANVQIKGLNVGHVSSMRLINGKGVKVGITINKGIELPEGTVASLQSFDLLGTKMLVLIPGPGPGILKPGATLPATREGGIIDNVTAELTPRLKQIKGTISSFDTTLAGVNAMVNAHNQQEIAEALQYIKTTAANMAELSEALKNQTNDITAIVRNANSITANLAKNNEVINKILANTSNISSQMAAAPIQKTMADLQATIAQFKDIADKINNNQGSLGLLINNKDAYNNLSGALRSADSLERDIRLHPSRYINVTLFGGGKSR